VKVLIVGGVAGGASAAARLRRLNEKAEIIMFERGRIHILCKLRASVLYRG
jgi:NADPH-dependent 2,4-dienoyl-CoA reductase/sulfur reductase-like enzyme